MADLLADGLGQGDRAAALLAKGELPAAADAKLPALARWDVDAEGSVEAALPEGATHLFFVADGRKNPIDQLEALKGWISSRPVELARVICVVDCKLAESNPKLFAWFEACIYFSDVVLLNHRDGVPNKWMGDFTGKFQAKFYPCLFEFVREGRVKNPALVLAPVAHRMSHAFDEEEWIVADEDDEDEDEAEMAPEVDPYFERRNGGRRVHEIPNISDFLPKPAG